MSLDQIIAACKAAETSLTAAEIADARWECCVPMFEGAVSWCRINRVTADAYLVELRRIAANTRAAARLAVYRS